MDVPDDTRRRRSLSRLLRPNGPNPQNDQDEPRVSPFKHLSDARLIPLSIDGQRAMAVITRGIKNLFKRKSNASKNDISNATNESDINSDEPLDIDNRGDTTMSPSELQSQPNTPAAVLDTATKTFHSMKLAPGVLKEGSSNINSFEKGIDLSISSLLNTLKAFNSISEKLSAIHPYVQAACTVLSGISKIITDQADRDRSVQNLLDTMTDLYMVLNNERLEDIESMKSIVQCICQQTLECAYFIEGYAKDQKFRKLSFRAVVALMRSLFYEDTRVAKNTLSRTDDRVAQYQNAFLELRHGFETRASLETLLAGRETLLVVHRIWDKMDTLDDIARRVELSSLPYPSGVGLNLSKVCLEGTRREVLDEITGWALSTDTATPRVFWLHGNAGTGKSAISHTIAHRLKTIKRLGSCFCFDRSALAEKRHEAIFSTIAQDLSSLDEGMRRALSATIARDVSLRNTTDIIQQWKEFILKPAKIVSDTLSGPIVIVIDALDESGDPDSRELLLKILAGRMGDIDDQIHQLPANIRILLTSRPLPDINDSLHGLAHIHQKSMDSISNESTETDIRSYINSKLAWSGAQKLEEERVYALATVSGGLFEWARLACAYIDKRNQGGLTPKERFERIVARARDARDYLLDDMYRITLEAILPEDADDVDTFLVRFRSIMAQIIGTAEPMTVASLKAMRKFFPKAHCGISVETIVLPMGALLTGTTGASAVRPLHASFTDFLTHKERSKDFFVDISSIHGKLAFACLGLMEANLRFNACNLPSSYLANSEVPNLVERVKQNISVELSYSCRFWTLHLHYAKVTEPLVELVRAFFGHERLLFWIEVLGLLKKISTCSSALSRVMEWANLPGLDSRNGMNDLTSSCQDLGDSAADVQRFIRVFGGAISLSTPHLYVSALPFSPINSSVFQKFSARFPKVLQIVRGRRACWPVAQAVLRGHTQVVNCVAFSPDGRLIISGSDDSTIRIWDAETGNPLRSSLSGHTNWVYSVAFSADGKRFVSGSGDRTLRLWDSETGEVATLRGHKGPVTSVAFSPDGKQIASGSYDKTICLWSTETRKQLCPPLEGHGGSVMSLAFSPNGRYIVSGSNDKTVRLWDVEKKLMLHPALDGHSHCVRSVTFSPDGCLAVSGADDCTIRIWNVETTAMVGGFMYDLA
ncbi:hypothetical protein CVT26_002507 [Gymnopilus dilepis]|uniref:NACHT domain-containing protein n=1 Tax=Gymnopilus dilepis TaxID=231916 RepID=A0A409YNC4_9AGAR|nr:hypothetical protein CVT26_002507 [Gymnopilus dilepis]